MNQYHLLFSRLLFRLSKSALFEAVIGWGFAYFSALLPVKRVASSACTVSFFHPKPSYDHHILLVPKKKIPNFKALITAAYILHLIDILRIAFDYARKNAWSDYSLGVNGGPYQEVPQVHFHLYKGQDHFREITPDLLPQLPESSDEAVVLDHPRPSRAFHTMICCPPELTVETLSDQQAGALQRILGALNTLDDTNDLSHRGYTVFVQFDNLPEGLGMVFHVVSGEERE